MFQHRVEHFHLASLWRVDTSDSNYPPSPPTPLEGSKMSYSQVSYAWEHIHVHSACPWTWPCVSVESSRNLSTQWGRHNDREGGWRRQNETSVECACSVWSAPAGRGCTPTVPATPSPGLLPAKNTSGGGINMSVIESPAILQRLEGFFCCQNVQYSLGSLFDYSWFIMLCAYVCNVHCDFFLIWLETHY